MHTSILFAKQVTAREYKKPASERNSSEYAMKRKEQFGFPAFLPLFVLQGAQ
jgi:hypothetical protein